MTKLSVRTKNFVWNYEKVLIFECIATEITGLHKTLETLEGACLEVVPPCMRGHVTRVWAVERSMLEEETEIFHHLEIT